MGGEDEEQMMERLNTEGKAKEVENPAVVKKKIFGAYEYTPQMTLKNMSIAGCAALFFLAFVGSPLFLVSDNYASSFFLSAAPDLANNFADLDSPFDEAHLPIFWHVPKSYGSSLRAYYSCMGLVEAGDASELSGHGETEDLYVWERICNGDCNVNALYVNVDTSGKEGIMRAQRLGLAQSGLADLATTMHLGFATNMFTPEYKGRIFTLLRHPVEQQVSFFYERQIVEWEQKGGVERPKLADFDVKSWFEERRKHDNGGYVVSLLLDKDRHEPITEADMALAKRFMKEKFLIGLSKRMPASFERFDKYFGWFDNEKRGECLKTFGQLKAKGENDPKKIEVGSELWNYIAESYKYDVELFNYAEELWEDQATTSWFWK
mmetsp:Transcript_31421/g.45806  ORF Transcript_31421/g.45806 Transcript_31421/m.45806 type:complete len:378 (-) Transcript_31421:405-1538(-)